MTSQSATRALIYPIAEMTSNFESSKFPTPNSIHAIYLVIMSWKFYLMPYVFDNHKESNSFRMFETPIRLVSEACP